MYQAQLINLLREFSLATNKYHNLHKLLNDIDYRNHSLQTAKSQNNSKIALLVAQIQALEDLLNHQLQVDLLAETKPQAAAKKQRLGMAVLAFSGLMFMAASVITVEEVKQQRKQSEVSQAD